MEPTTSLQTARRILPIAVAGSVLAHGVLFFLVTLAMPAANSSQASDSRDIRLAGLPEGTEEPLETQALGARPDAMTAIRGSGSGSGANDGGSERQAPRPSAQPLVPDRPAAGVEINLAMADAVTTPRIENRRNLRGVVRREGSEAAANRGVIFRPASEAARDEEGDQSDGGLLGGFGGQGPIFGGGIMGGVDKCKPGEGAGVYIPPNLGRPGGRGALPGLDPYGNVVPGVQTPIGGRGGAPVTGGRTGVPNRLPGNR